MKFKTLRLVKILAGLVVAALVLHTVLLLASGLALRDAYAALHTASRPMTPADIIPKDIPASENAAPLYESAFALLKSESSNGRGLIHALGYAAREFLAEPDSEAKRETMEALLANNVVIRSLELVQQASQRPRCNFQLPYDQGAMLLAPHVHGMLTVCRTLQAKALLETRQGHGAQAWQTVELSLRMANALGDEPILISALVRIAQFQMALTAMHNVAEAFPPNAETLVRLEPLIAPADDMAPYLLALDGERLFIGEWAHQKFPAWTPKEIFSLVGGEGPNWGIWPMDLLRRYRPARQADHALYLRAMQGIAQDAQRPYWETGTERYRDAAFPWYSVTTRLILPALAPSRVRMVLLQANARISRTGLALLRHQAAHGAYPATLAELDPQFLAEIPLDPFTGKPLVYRPEGAGFVLYSLGENLADDGGTEETKDTRDSKAFDIVWRMPR
jgi:hypothetical protein